MQKRCAQIRLRDKSCARGRGAAIVIGAEREIGASYLIAPQRFLKGNFMRLIPFDIHFVTSPQEATRNTRIDLSG